MASTYQTPARDRIVAGIGTALVMVLLGYALLAGLIVRRGLPQIDTPLLLTVDTPPPPKEHIVPEPKSRAKAGKASARNLRNTPSEVVAPKPLTPPPPVKLRAAPIAGLGLAPLAGASDRPGPGTGAGGQGNGTGSGGAGDGDGGGYTAPEHIKGSLDYSAVPHELREAGVQGNVGVRYVVNVDGRASHCSVTSSSGSAALDQVTCALIEKRFRFEPSHDPSGHPVVSQIEENHTWIMDRREQAQ
ncbi:protein TonB [Sphingomonas vulcanisoli]|uniref:Protein TonB n=1 Tax=Sphingomonas vulcanisoli TaxID=1658060 RepID=A0ABX0TN05_9SPHN|nr:TonB family protein [Sphingomonas vulcanisoli]NIJ06909.1 protein TonB [Sphingomonas vulcanisoli]